MKTKLILIFILLAISASAQFTRILPSQLPPTNSILPGDLVTITKYPGTAQEQQYKMIYLDYLTWLAASGVINSNMLGLITGVTNGMNAHIASVEAAATALATRVGILEAAAKDRNMTNIVMWASNSVGVFPIPHWDIGSMAGRPVWLGRSNEPLMTLRYAGVQPNGVDEGPNDNVIYIGDDSPTGKDAISFQMRNVNSSGRLTFVFDDDTYTWRFQATNFTYAFSDSGLNWPLLSVNNAVSTAIPLLSVGITNPVGTTVVKSSNVTVQSSSTSVGLYFQTNSTAVNGSLYMDSSGILWLRTNSSWVIK